MVEKAGRWPGSLGPNPLGGQLTSRVTSCPGVPGTEGLLRHGTFRFKTGMVLGHLDEWVTLFAARRLNLLICKMGIIICWED